MKIYTGNRGFTLIELLATIAIMAVLIVAALPYVADYTSWARATSEARDAQVVAGAIARWIAVGGGTGSSQLTGALSGFAWTNAVFADGNSVRGFTGSTGSAKIIKCLYTGWTVVPGGNRDPFLAPNTSYTQLGQRIKIIFTSSRNYTVAPRSH